MKAIILCGGKGTRFNRGKPGPLKPLIKVNGTSILKRIINIYKKNGIKDFILLGGYKFDELKAFEKKYSSKQTDIKAINTGINTNTAGRLLYLKKIIKDENFLLTYGDSLTNFNLNCLKLKNKNNLIMSVFKYNFQYGYLETREKLKLISAIHEKKDFYINAGFYILDSKIFSYIKDKKESFEKDTIPKILKKNRIKFYYNEVSQWFPMDSQKDKKEIEKYLKYI